MNNTQRMPKIPLIKHKRIDNHKYDNYELFFGQEALSKTERNREKTAKRIGNIPALSIPSVDPLSKLYITEKIMVNGDKEHLSTLPTEKTDYVVSTTEPDVSTKYLQQIEHTKLLTEAKLPKPRQLIRKTKALNRKKESVNEFIAKTRDMILMKYTTNIKKERAVRLKETYENEIESIKDTIDSMEQARTLFNENFFVKFGDYVKHLAVQKEQEKAKSSNLLEQILKQKNEILQLQNKIKKQESDKANAIRWLFFQVQVKEKKLWVYSPALLLKIEKCKNGLVFNTPEDFLDELKKLETLNVAKLNEYNDLCVELQELKKEKERLISEDERSGRLILRQLEVKQKEMEQVMQRHRQLVKEKEVIEETPMKRNANVHHTHHGQMGKDKAVSYLKSASYSKLVERITQLHKTTMEIQLKREFEVKKLTVNEVDILGMLVHIEHVIDFLLAKFDYYQSNKTSYGKMLKTIQSAIEKEHKIEKARRQRQEEENRFLLLKEKIEERNNKIYYLPKKKVDDFAQYVLKKEKKDDSANKVKAEPTFEDFMYDIESSTI